MSLTPGRLKVAGLQSLPLGPAVGRDEALEIDDTREPAPGRDGARHRLTQARGQLCCRSEEAPVSIKTNAIIERFRQRQDSATRERNRERLVSSIVGSLEVEGHPVSHDAVREAVRALHGKYATPGRSLADELHEERRAEAEAKGW